MGKVKKLFLPIALLLLIASPSEAQVITANIISRVFLIKYGEMSGSSFTIEVDDRQYLITARHVVNGIKDGDKIEIFHDNGWKKMTVKPLYIEPSEVDIVVLVPPFQLSPTLPLEPSSDGIVLSQTMFFLGFPFGMRMPGTMLNSEFPVPLVKSGICSAIMSKPKDCSLIIVDGLNNPGFSGGPIVFKHQKTNRLRVAGVIGGFRHQNDRVYREVPKKDKKPGDEDELVPTDMIVKSNTGIIVGHNIKSAVDVILRHPIGPMIKK